ncbi:MAG TPA: hypothetical protein VIK50_00595 [Gemmatimonadaceae bacterium]
MPRLALLLALILSALPAALPAQVMPATVVRRGGANGLAMSDGEPISFILEHAQILDLVDSQRTSLMSLRRRLRATNAPYMRQLDSLRETLGISLEPRQRGLNDEDRKKLQRLEQLSQPITDSIKVNNDAANLQARGLLDSVQVVRLDSLVLRERGTIGGRRPPPSQLRLFAGRSSLFAAR